MKKFRFILIAFFAFFLVACDFGGTSQNEKEACIIFNTMGGKLLSVMSDLEVGEVVTLPIPTKTNANFLGWYTTRDYTDTVLGTEYTYEKPITLYAKWEVSGYTLTFNFGEEKEQLVYNLKGGEDISEYIPLPDKNYHTYQFSPSVPEIMPQENLTINATLINLEEEYSIEDNTITSYLGNDYNITIPTNYYLDGEIINITTIGDWAFFGNDDIMNIVIPTGITTIKEYAFYFCEEIRTVTIYEGVETIGDSAFNGALYLQKIDLPKSIKNISSEAFQDCEKLTNINVHEDNEYYASHDGNLYSKDLTELMIYAPGKSDDTFVIPNFVKKISPRAFYNADDLEHITIPEGVEEIGMYAFSSCYSLKEVVIPSTVKTIHEGAFYICDEIESVTISDGVETISDDAFFGCSSIQSLDIPASVLNIGNCPFLACENLLNINVHENNPNYKSVDGNLYTKDGEVLITYCVAKPETSFTVPEGVKVINEAAIHSANNLTTIILPNTVTTLYDRAIFNIINMTEITIPSSVTFMEDTALHSCDILKNIFVDENNQYYKSIDGNLYTKDVTVLLIYCTPKEDTRFVIPNTVTTIAEEAFSYTFLEEIVIPESVTTIGDLAFLFANNLTIYCEVESKPDTWKDNWNSYCPVVWGYEISE